MKQALKRWLRGRILGPHMADDIAPDIPTSDASIIKMVWPKYTLTSPDRLHGLLQSVRYLEERQIPGAFVECGVWRGGSAMAMVYALQEYAREHPYDTVTYYERPTTLLVPHASRNLWLYDTYEGMSPPDDRDLDFNGRSAADMLRTSDKTARGGWCYASLPDVLYNMRMTNYPMPRMHFVEGKVEDTIPGIAPDQIALLRLDTDWYESTKHELVHLYPRLVSGGILIIDDYGHWKGSRQATDEYLDTLPVRPFLHRLDYSARLLVKP